MSSSKISLFQSMPTLGNAGYTKLTVDPQHLDTLVFEDTSSIPFDYHNSLDRNVVDSGLIPPGLRFSIPGFLVFERPPTRKLVQYIDYSVSEMSDGVYDDDSEETFYLSQDQIDQRTACYEIPIPWQIYMVTYSTSPSSAYAVTYIRMYFSNTPLSDPNTRLYMPYINNFFTDGSMCNPMIEDYSEISRYPKNLEGVIASAYDWIWNTGFNRDLYECVDLTISTCYKNNPIITDAVDNKGLFAGVTRRFYKIMSEYSVDDVVSLEWANPSYTQHHQRDMDFLYRYSKKYHEIYYDLCGKTDPESKYIDSSEHYFSIIGKPEKIQKTYLDIIEYMFFDSSALPFKYIPYHDILKNIIPQFQNFESYVNGLIQYNAIAQAISA